MSLLSIMLLVHVSLAASAAPPNILLLTTDQQRLDSMACYGSTFAQSPNIDRLAQEGVRYTESYTASPVCMSARASWISGTQVPVHNVWGNGISPRRQWAFGNMIQPLNEAGYFTAVLGKTHYDPVPDYGYTDIHSGNTDMRKPNMHSAHFLETYLVNQAKMLLQNQIKGVRIPKGQPWYLHLSFVSPHPPSHVPLEWQAMYKNTSFPRVKFGGPRELASYPQQLKGFMDKEKMPKAFPGGQPDNVYIEEFRRSYYALANYVDYQVGRMLDFLDLQGLASNTLVVFTSDHGTNLWDHGFPHKYNFFDGSWRVPLILRGPGLPRGLAQEFAAGVDVPATVLAAAGAKRPAGLNGFDLVGPLRRGEPAPRSGGVAGSLLQALALVTRKWKLTFYLDDGRGQLFDRSNDPDELNNLFDDPGSAHVKGRLLTALLRWRAGLEPVGFLQTHEVGDGGFEDTQFVYDYTMNLTGVEPEVELQAELAHPELQGAPERLWVI
eukprot:CAMPEP_0179020034 /NCGR_PEP_ID=MMETSP0796-20121207/5174_1 /TAXON_ID=73915 /ORGANISM="Pyrodinium bahamense, Strain pbaha01" /LENGTH=493 /DNA_ID=CAMNT_0020715837 /DNA_START=13 /DNA_END=1494 /DNA_ORIENTATION=+